MLIWVIRRDLVLLSYGGKDDETTEPIEQDSRQIKYVSNLICHSLL